MVGHVVVQIQERQPRAQEALSLPGRQAKHQAQGDRRLDGVFEYLRCRPGFLRVGLGEFQLV